MGTKQLLYVCATVAAAASFALPASTGAQVVAPAGGGSSSGSGQTATPADATWLDTPFGSRDLSLGMSGTDVKTLNWVLRGLALGTTPDAAFSATTDGAVRSFQATAGLAANGIVAQTTRKALATRMPKQNASWYGPGLYGNTTACGQKLTKKIVGVAHKKLPCGTKVAFAYKGRWVRAKVVDRGPFIPGRKWDLTFATATQLGTIPVGTAKVKAVAAP